MSRPARRRILIAGGLAAIVAIAAGTALVVGRFAGRDAAAARRALAEGRLDEASAALGRWLESSPDSAEAHHLKARIAWARRDLDTVYAELERAGVLGYPPEKLARLRGLFLARTNQPGKAEPFLRHAFDTGREPDREVAEALARIYLGSFRLADAGAVLDRWAREIPGDARPYLLRTEVAIRINKDAEFVIRLYREALRLDPDLDPARLGLAEMLGSKHRNSEAAAEYDRYMARKPDDPMGYLGAGQNALEMGDAEKAVRWLDRAVALAPRNPVVLGARADVEVQARRFPSGLDYITRAVEADPFDYVNRSRRRAILARLGKKAEAEAEFQAMERIRKEKAEFDRLSLELLESPLDPKLRSAVAQWLMNHGHAEESIEWANLVLAANPSHPAMNRMLADYYRKSGQVGLANFHEALASPPTEPERGNEPGASASPAR